MADDGEVSNNKPKSQHRPQETFHTAQETPAEHRFPNTTGIVPLPAGSRGPKSLYLKRNGDSFGFTLRHFIVYPPDSIAESDGRHAAVGALSAPMDTIFVKHVKDRSPAKLAGLQCGDRLLRVNRIPVTDKTYAQVVQLIQNSPDYLHLLVVPKEDDILQRYFAETAYNPASNQQLQQPQLVPPRVLTDRQAAQHFLTQTFSRQLPKKFQVDAISWRSLQNSYGYDYKNRPSLYEYGQQKSADNLDLRERVHSVQYYPDDSVRRTRPRAQPQVPLYRKMGRRASDGCALSEREYYNYEHEQLLRQPELSGDYEDMVVNNSSKMKAIHKTNNYLPENQNNQPELRYPNAAGCRLSLDAGRRESSSSLTSSLADGSKDSLTSFDSTSTLTGHDTDDSAIMSRFRKSVQQKEEFLKMPTDSNVIQREFYSRPKKLERAMWPPERQESPSRGASKPTHQNFQRVKNDIEIERDLLAQTGGVAGVLPQQKGAKSPNDKASVDNFDRIKEASTAPAGLDNVEELNGATEGGDTFSDEKRVYPASLQMVHTRARQFESGKPLPEDDPILSNRMSFYRSELARLSSKRVVPNVTERAQEFETRSSSNETRREPPPPQPPPAPPAAPPTSSSKKVQRDSRSLESSETSENQAISIRARSNSAESWAAALPEKKSSDTISSNNKRISRQDAIIDDGNKTKDDHQTAEVPGEIPYADLPPLIPEPVEQMQFTPSLSVTPASPTVLLPVPQPPSTATKAVRPNQLDLEGPTRPSRHLKPPTSNIDTPIRRPVSPVIGEDNKPVVVKRRTKTTNLADDERTTRRESYLKATEGGRMHFDSDLSDGDVSPQVLRSGSVSGNSSSSASLDREKINASPLEKDKHAAAIREGPLHCKITEIDGKRFGDRSWKQIWAVLRGPKLFLYKDKHHQSPMGTSDVVEHSLATGVDMRASEVRVAEDYTKRKHVLRVSSAHPCRSEVLLQADNTEEFTDWFKTLQEQMATNTEAETKLDTTTRSKQQAVPQTVPASTSILVAGSSRLSPQPSKSKSASTRNRSPTGQSPVSKTRKPSQTGGELPSTSPKGKNWRVRVAKQFRRNFGGSSPSSPTAPEGSTFGVPIDQCLCSDTNPYVPKFVEVCTDIVDARGLQTVGIYRVPGNNASITALTEEVNRNYDVVPVDDPRWNDLHVVSSLLKAYFRKIPDSLVTSALYPSFIKADKIENPEQRMKELKRLVKSLPPHNYHTLKHIILHLRKVVENADVNKMEAKNLAIVFGPNIVRPEDDNMETMVNNMTHQCKIVETFLTCADWFFSDDSDAVPVPAVVSDAQEESEAGNQALLLDNISKYEALKDKEKNGALFSSIISAAQRKVKRKSTKGAGSLNESKEEVISQTDSGIYSSGPHIHSDLRDSTTTTDSRGSGGGGGGVIPTTVHEMEKLSKKPQPEKVPWFNYSTDKEDFYRRVENFRQETEAMLKKPRNLEISVNNIVSKSGSLSSSASSVNQSSATAATAMTNNNRLSTKSVDSHLLKTHSASNVFARTMPDINSRHSLDNSYSVQYTDNKNGSDFGGSLRYSNNQQQYVGRDANRNVESGVNNGAYHLLNKGGGGGDARFPVVVRRGSSVENVNSTSVDLNANGTMKKVKYENESDIGQRVGSLDSLNKMVPPLDDDTDLVTTLTTLYDKLLEKEHHSRENLLEGRDLPYADESPEKSQRLLVASGSDKENVPNLHDQYRNPSLHKNQFAGRRGEETKDADKDEDSTMSGDHHHHHQNHHLHHQNNSTVPEKERHISHKLAAVNKNKSSLSSPGSKLKRSESLNKPEKTVASPLNNKLKRSESLNKTGGDKVLKRSDSLTKTEKTESNLSKRRELATSIRRSKEVTKLKRKNGMPDRSIKRRHTVGGTKDPDKVTWLDNKYQEEITSNKENKEKNLRTSSPDLSSTRRERLCFEINLIGPENMVVALKQHLMGARPQSFPDTTVFKVPLESHV